MDKDKIEERLEYIAMELQRRNYKILDDSISQGNVYKISFRGNLDVNMFEHSFLYLPKGSSIKTHKHTEDIELYLLIRGSLSVFGEKVNENMCFLGEEHNIDPVEEDTFIETFKLSKKYLEKVSSEYKKNKEKLLSKTYNRLEYELSL